MQSLNLEAPNTRPFGQRVGNLTRFGETWINVEVIESVTFQPADGCGCEVDTHNSTLHLSVEDAHCLRLYLTQLESIARQVDEAASIPIHAEA